jgi:hypothetical protein
MDHKLFFNNLFSSYNLPPPPGGTSIVVEHDLYLALLATCFHSSSLFGLLLDRDNEDVAFLRKVSWLSMDYTALHPGGQYFVSTAVKTLNPTHVKCLQYLNCHDDLVVSSGLFL